MPAPVVRARCVAVWLLAACLVLVCAPGARAASKGTAVVAKGSCTEVRGAQLVATFDVIVRGRRPAKAKRGPANRVTGGRVLGRLPTRFRRGRRGARCGSPSPSAPSAPAGTCAGARRACDAAPRAAQAGRAARARPRHRRLRRPRRRAAPATAARPR